MVNIIIILVVLVLLALAVKSSLGHFKGDGSCCGGNKGVIKRSEKRLEGPVVSEKHVKISGMSCSSCADRVKSAIDSVEGCVSEVDFRKGIATVKCDRTTVTESEIRKVITDAGYSVVSIS